VIVSVTENISVDLDAELQDCVVVVRFVDSVRIWLAMLMISLAMTLRSTHWRSLSESESLYESNDLCRSAILDRTASLLTWHFVSGTSTHAVACAVTVLKDTVHFVMVVGVDVV